METKTKTAAELNIGDKVGGFSVIAIRREEGNRFVVRFESSAGRKHDAVFSGWDSLSVEVK